MRPSDAAPTSGRLWSPDAAVNAPLTGRVSTEHARAYPVRVVARTQVIWTGGTGRVHVGGTRSLLIVDVDARQVLDVKDGTVEFLADLDGDAVGRAAGFVLARELVHERVEHAVAVAAPFSIGTRLAITATNLDPMPTASATLGRALRTHGAIVVDEREDVGLDILVECPPSATHTPGRELGPVYRACGLARYETALGTVDAVPYVPSPARRRLYRLLRS